MMAKSLLPATALPNIGGAQVTLESDVLVAVFLVAAAVLYFRQVPQRLYAAIMTPRTGDNGRVSPVPGNEIGVWGNPTTTTAPPVSPVFTPPSVSPTVGVGNPAPPYASFQGVIVPTSFDPIKFPAGATIDPQPGGYIGQVPGKFPFFRSCWSLPDGSTVGLCNG